MCSGHADVCVPGKVMDASCKRYGDYQSMCREETGSSA